MTFKRDNNKNKKLYYQLFVVVEIMILIGLYYFGIHWFILLLSTPIFLMDAWSNIRCANRQKKFIAEIEINEQGLTCTLANNRIEKIPHDKSLFSIREKKFEKDRTEIEIRQKRHLRSRLIGRIHIKNWKDIFEIKNELIRNNIAQVKYRPEGYWSKYGTLTADVAITGAALTTASVALMAGDTQIARGLSEVILPIHQAKDVLKGVEEKKTSEIKKKI